MSSSTTSGAVSTLTILGNQVIVVLKDAKGNAQPPQALMAAHDNYNTMYSALLMATGNRCEVDLHTDNSGIAWIVLNAG